MVTLSCTIYFLVGPAAFLGGPTFHVFTFNFELLELITLMTRCCASILKMDETFLLVSLIAWSSVVRLLEL